MWKETKTGHDWMENEDKNQSTSPDYKLQQALEAEREKYQQLVNRYAILRNNYSHLTQDMDQLKSDYTVLIKNRQMLVELIHSRDMTDASRKLALDLRNPKLENPLSKYQMTSGEQQENLEIVEKALREKCLPKSFHEMLTRSFESYLELPPIMLSCFVQKYLLITHYNSFRAEVKQRLKDNPFNLIHRKLFLQNILKFINKQKKQKLIKWQKLLTELDAKKQALLQSQSQLCVRVIFETGIMLNVPRLVTVKGNLTQSSTSAAQLHTTRIAKESSLTLPKLTLNHPKPDSSFVLMGTAVIAIPKSETLWIPVEKEFVSDVKPVVPKLLDMEINSVHRKAKKILENLQSTTSKQISLVQGYEIQKDGHLLNTDFPDLKSSRRSP